MKRSKFSLSNKKVLSFDMGELVPICLTEALPGDSVQQATSALIRLAPMLAPVYHATHIYLSHWFVPHRLIWEDFEDMITGGPAGTSLPVHPTIAMSYAAGPPATGSGIIGELGDYLGVPPGINGLEVSALPFRGYALIWNEWYRDQDLQTELVIDTTSGPDTTTNTALQRASWGHDYFTDARPWEQKGPAITIPLGTRADVKGIGTKGSTNVGAVTGVKETGGGTVTYANAYELNQASDGFMNAVGADGFPNVYADLTGASAITVGRLREALALQRYEEARARFGSRYVEYLRYLGVRSSDARLQRPEFLGGGRYPIQYSEVVQTAEGSDPVGELRGHGIGAARSNRFRRHIEEHGFIFTFACVKPKTMYIQGLARHWNRRNKEDYFQKELQHIGQQEILNKEVYAPGANPNDTWAFGNRYDEYRRSWDSVAGEMRDTLKFWHFGRSFTGPNAPALNADFVKCTPNENPFAVPSADVLYAVINNSIQARRIVAGSSNSFIY